MNVLGFGPTNPTDGFAICSIIEIADATLGLQDLRQIAEKLNATHKDKDGKIVQLLDEECEMRVKNGELWAVDMSRQTSCEALVGGIGWATDEAFEEIAATLNDLGLLREDIKIYDYTI